MIKRRFKIKKSVKLTETIKTVDENGKLNFNWIDIVKLAKASGLRSNKKRHIVKRFRLLIKEAVDALTDHLKTVDNTLSK